MPPVKRVPTALELDCRALTNRVSHGHVCASGAQACGSTRGLPSLGSPGAEQVVAWLTMSA
jgi:hypothetical protein